MLGVVLAFMAATVLVPAAQSVVAKGTQKLPFGLDKVQGVVFVVTLAASLLLLFAILCVIYWSVPNRSVPWRAIWPGAVVSTIAVGIVDYGFPLYLSSASTFAKLGTVLVFVVIVLLWFYTLAIIVLGGGVVNAMRFELHETGELSLE
jgi:membrane protein